MAKIRVLIADDHAILRAGLAMLVNAQPDMEVVGEASNGSEALQRVLKMEPDVVLMDLTMPETNSFKVIEGIRKECPRTRVLVLTMHDDPAYLRSALAVGASGYIVKKAADTELLGGIRAVHRGRTFVDLTIAGDLAEPLPGKARPLLSQRETEVLRLLVQGHTNQQIADSIHVSVKTVETYRARLAQKLGLSTRADLVRYALETGLLTIDTLPPQDQ